MNYKSAIATPTAPPPKAIETPYLTIDEVYQELQQRFHVSPLLSQTQPSPASLNTPTVTLEDASDHVANMFAQLSSYWKAKGYLSKASVTGFCDMLKEIFHLQYLPSLNDESTSVSFNI